MHSLRRFVAPLPRAVPRGGCALPRSPPLDGMLMTPSLTYQRPSLRGLGHSPLSMFDGHAPLTTGGKRVRSPRSADADLSCRFTRSSCECSRAVKMYHSLIDLKSEVGVSDCLFRRCSPRAWLRPSTSVNSMVWAAANLGCALTKVTKRCWKPQWERHRVVLQSSMCSGPGDNMVPISAPILAAVRSLSESRCRNAQSRVGPNCRF